MSERLLASLVVGRADPKALDAADAATLVPLATAHGLEPMLLAALHAAGVETGTERWTPLVTRVRALGQWYLAARAEQASIERALAPLGVRCIWLKGYALAHTVYARPALRPMRDLDFLVPAERGDHVVHALRALGYEPANGAPPVFDGDAHLLHHYPRLRGRRGIPVEVHHRLLQFEPLLPKDEHAWFHGQVVETDSSGVRLSHLRPEAQLLHLCAHAILAHGEGEFRLQRYLDCHLVVTREPSLDWGLVIDQAAALGWSQVVQRAFSLTADYFGTPVPARVWRALDARPTSAGAAAVAAALGRDASPTSFALAIARSRPKSVRQLYRIIRLAVPSIRYMRWRYGVAGWRLPIAYLLRWTGFVRDAIRVRRQTAR